MTVDEPPSKLRCERVLARCPTCKADCQEWIDPHNRPAIGWHRQKVPVYRIECDRCLLRRAGPTMAAAYRRTLGLS